MPEVLSITMYLIDVTYINIISTVTYGLQNVSIDDLEQNFNNLLL